MDGFFVLWFRSSGAEGRTRRRDPTRESRGPVRRRMEWEVSSGTTQKSGTRDLNSPRL